MIKNIPIIDIHFQNKLSGGEVLTHNGVSYSAHLNLTDIKNNSNKYYIIQIVKYGT